MGYNFDEINNRYNTGSYKYDRIKESYPNANKDTIIMTLADMDFKTAPCVQNKIKELADKGIFGYMTEYFPPYQNAVKHWYKSRFNLELADDEIIFSNGTIEGIKAIISLYTKEGDYVALSRPVYGHFSSAIEDELNRKVLNIDLINNNLHYELDYDSIREKLSNPRCNVYILCSPQNPVGRVWKKEELKKLIDICQETNTILISDEVHSDIVRKGIKHYPIFEATDNYKGIVMMTSIGKTFNLSGLQCSNMIIKDKELYNNVRNNFDRDISCFAQGCLIAAYSEGEGYVDALNEYLDKNIDFALNELKAMPYIKALRPEGGYFLWLDFTDSGLTKEEITDRIYNKANIILQSGLNHDPDNGAYFQRMPLAFPRSVIEEVFKRLKAVFSDLR